MTPGAGVPKTVEGFLLSAALLLAALVQAAPAQAPAIVVPDWRAIPMVVGEDGERRWTGTGVVVGERRVLTARHVLGKRMRIHLPQGVVDGRVVCREPRTDLGVLEAPLPPGTPVYRLAFRLPRVGETLTMAGYPRGRRAVTRVAVTAIHESARIDQVLFTATVMRLSGRLAPGASGSPLFDQKTAVVGIVAGSGDDGTGAFPSAVLRECLRFLTKSFP